MKNDYYVYLHKTLDGVVFYVGKGRSRRAWKAAGRSQGWKESASAGYVVEMYKSGLSEKEALQLENTLITTLDGLVNNRIFSPVKFDNFAEYFSYDTESPSCLTRIKNVKGGKIGHCGSKAKRSCGGQHWLVGFQYRAVRVHRIVWQLFYGEIPDGFVIDHINGDSLNNKIENLRMVSSAENRRNTRKDKVNKSGVVGVRLYVDTRRNTPGAWCASFTDLNGKLFNKYFSVLKYGNDEAFKMACDYRKQKILELNQKGAGYTERHGT